MKAWHSLPPWSAWLACLLGACVLPIPVFSKQPSSDQNRGAFVDARRSGLQRGVSTREDVLLAFGEPDVRCVDDRRFAYVRTEAWLLVLAFSLRDAGGFELVRHRAMVFAFDPQGVLTEWAPVDQARMASDSQWFFDLKRE
ncbi:MAG: hypothetical protein RL398_771 [Planctomycetota bacterium]|jgi:hypothetical protein